jgi:hypothetical protein
MRRHATDPVYDAQHVCACVECALRWKSGQQRGSRSAAGKASSGRLTSVGNALHRGTQQGTRRENYKEKREQQRNGPERCALRLALRSLRVAPCLV